MYKGPLNCVLCVSCHFIYFFFIWGGGGEDGGWVIFFCFVFFYGFFFCVFFFFFGGGVGQGIDYLNYARSTVSRKIIVQFHFRFVVLFVVV